MRVDQANLLALLQTSGLLKSEITMSGLLNCEAKSSY